MTLRHIERKDIDTNKWDCCIEQAHNSMIYAMSWYLDVVADHWDALVFGDYEIVMPIPYRVKFGFIRYVYQPCFIQQLGIYSKEKIHDQLVNTFISYLIKKYKYIHINLNEVCNSSDFVSFFSSRNNYILDLNYSFEYLSSKFSPNAKLNIKRAYNFSTKVKVIEDFQSVIHLFRDNNKKYGSRYSTEDYEKLKKLLTIAKTRNQLDVIGLFDSQDQLCAGGIFLSHKNKKIFIFSGRNQVAHKHKMMFFLFNDFIKQHSNKELILDFEGSNDLGLASFYGGFGSVNEPYPMLQVNTVSRFLQWIKQ